MVASRRLVCFWALVHGAAGSKWLQTSASRIIRAPITQVFGCYADLERMPEWSPVSQVTVDACTLESTWMLSYAGIDVSWRARVLESQPPSLLRWESVSGARNMGEVRFTALGEDECKMDLTMSYQIPASIARIVESDLVQSFIVRVCLKPTMRRFGDAMEGVARSQSETALVEGWPPGR